MKIERVRVGRYVYRSRRSAKVKILFQSILLLLIAGCIFAAAADAPAGDFDGSRPLSGTTGKIIEINPYKIISDIDPDTIGIPKHFLIDFNTKTLHPAKDSLIKKTIAFHSLVHIENMLILQGADEGVEGVDDGLAWTLAISKKDGKAVLSASGDKVAYVVFGVCAPR
jgi:hypothetical protein